MRISEIDNDKITKIAMEKAKTPDECWYMYEKYLKPYVFKVGVLYGLAGGVFISAIIVLILIRIF